MMHVRSVEHLGDYRLKLTFSDGTSGTADLSETLSWPAFAPLKDIGLFSHAYIDVGTVCWPGDLDLAAEYLYALAHQLPPPKTFDDVIQNEQAVSLRELRLISGRTQVDVANEMGVAQGEISKLERREDAKLSTLRAYVEALGGTLELTAKVGERSVPLHAFLPPGAKTTSRRSSRPSSTKKSPTKCIAKR
jgi:transcriptional regulator with XRE-family HTH domain